MLMICTPSSTARTMPSARRKELEAPPSSPIRIERRSADGTIPCVMPLDPTRREATAVPWPCNGIGSSPVMRSISRMGRAKAEFSPTPVSRMAIRMPSPRPNCRRSPRAIRGCSRQSRLRRVGRRPGEVPGWRRGSCRSSRRRPRGCARGRRGRRSPPAGPAGGRVVRGGGHRCPSGGRGSPCSPGRS